MEKKNRNTVLGGVLGFVFTGGNPLGIVLCAGIGRLVAAIEEKQKESSKVKKTNGEDS